MRDQVMTDEQIRQAKNGLRWLIVMMSAYVATGAVLFALNLIYGMRPMAVWNAAWLLCVPWFTVRSVYELRRSNRALKSLGRVTG